ncbi:hypothetical protein KI387_016419, partial [Taxus chinensis]
VIIDLESAKQDFQEDLQATEYYLMQSRILYQRLMAANEQILEYSARQQHRKTQQISVAAANARSALHRTLRNFRESGSKVSVGIAGSSNNEKKEVSVKASMDHSPGWSEKIMSGTIVSQSSEIMVAINQFNILDIRLMITEHGLGETQFCREEMESIAKDSLEDILPLIRKYREEFMINVNRESLKSFTSQDLLEAKRGFRKKAFSIVDDN